MMKTTQLPAILWNGKNLKEMTDFFDKDSIWQKWFSTFEEYQKYVSEHNNTFKMFYRDGSHLELPVGTWIVKIPGGYAPVGEYVYVPAKTSEYIERLSNDFALGFIEKGQPRTPKEVTLHNKFIKTYMAGYIRGGRDEIMRWRYGKEPAEEAYTEIEKLYFE